jgi:hypothetical protein
VAKIGNRQVDAPVFEALEPRLLLSAAGYGVNSQSATADQAIRFAVIGDYGYGSVDEADVADLVASMGASFVVTTGDNRYLSLTYDEVVGRYYGAFMKDAQSGLYSSGGDSPVNAFFPSAGNHEYFEGGGIDEYLDYFTLPGADVDTTDTSGSERYYDFVQGPIHFFVLDSEGALRTSTDMAAQKDWLETQMTASTTPWQIVYMHHPPYSSSVHGPSIDMQWPYAQWGADVVISGHEHIYERIEADGIVYFINGLGGSSRYYFDIPTSGSEVRYNADFGAMMVDASSDDINFRFINRNGLVIDDYTPGQPSADMTVSNDAVGENEPAGTIVGEFSTLGPHASGIHAYSLASGAGDDDNASFTIDGDVLKTGESFDFETKDTYSILVRSTDADGFYSEKPFAISVVDAVVDDLYEALVSSFGSRGNGLVADVNGDGRVDLSDFAIIRANFGAAPSAPESEAAFEAPLAAVSELELDGISGVWGSLASLEDSRFLEASWFTEVIRPGENSATISPLVSSAPVIDLLAEMLSTGAYISEPQPISSVTPQYAATGAYDLRPLSDAPAADASIDEILADVLAESPIGGLF